MAEKVVVPVSGIPSLESVLEQRTPHDLEVENLMDDLANGSSSTLLDLLNGE